MLCARLGRTGLQRYRQNRLIHGLAIVLTFHFVCFTMLFFFLPLDQALRVLGTVASHALSMLQAQDGASFRHMTLVEAGLLLVVVLSLWVPGRRLAEFAAPRRVREWLAGSLTALHTLVLIETVLAVSLFLWMWCIDQREPVILYRRF